MATSLQTVFAIVLFVFAGAAFWGAWTARSRRRAISDTPTSPCGGLPQGPVEVKGAATLPPGAEPLKAPFTGAPCLYWQFAIEEKRMRRVHTKQGGHTRSEWVQVAAAASHQPIGVRDATGVALVNPSGADVPVTKSTTLRSGMFSDPPPHVVDVLRRSGVSHEGWFGVNKTMRYREHTLTDGVQLYVLGHAATGPEGRLVIGKPPSGPLLISTRSEETLLRLYALGLVAGVVFGLAFAGFGAYLLTGA